jgi:hypothetical protein
MKTRFAVSERPVEPSSVKRPFASGLRFDWTMVVLGSWVLIGGCLDARAHLHGLVETFFTPWHAVLYAGILALICFLGGRLFLHRVRSGSWQDAVPRAYQLSVVGALCFILAGVGDLLWHLFFGVETSVDASLSPTHLALATCFLLILSGPYRAAWQRPDEREEPGWRALLPMIVSLTLTWSSLTLITQFAHPFVWLTAADPLEMTSDGQALGVVSICLQTLILMGLVLLTLRRWRLPFGALTLMFTLNSVVQGVLQDHFFVIPVAAGAGLIADVLLKQLQPCVQRPEALRLFASVLPVVLYGLYFLALQLTMGIQWTLHLWLGSTVVAGICGLLLSYVLLPPLLPSPPGSEL